MFSPSREQVRRFLAESWSKRRDGAILTPLEHQAADVIALHPEYHGLLASGDDALARDFPPEAGETNPFLHLSLHLAIEEQLSIDQPKGIRDAFDRLCRERGDRHAALHDILECLAETIWRSQRDGVPLDGEAYLERILRGAG